MLSTPNGLPKTEPLQCSHCGSREGVKLESSRTAYALPEPTCWDRILREGEGIGQGPALEDPNKDIPLCRECSAEHHSYWDSMWDEYYRSR